MMIGSRPWLISVQCLLISTFLGACASDRDWTLIQEPSDYQFSQEQDGVTVAAEAWTRAADLRAAFGNDLLANDVLPMRIVIFNRGSARVFFSSTQAKLWLTEDAKLAVLPLSEVSDLIERNEAAAAAIIIIMTGAYGSPIASAISQSIEENNWEATSKLRQCAMDLVALDPQEAMTGFLFYDYEECKKRIKAGSCNWTLEIVRMPRDSGGCLRFRIPLTIPNKESR